MQHRTIYVNRYCISDTISTIKKNSVKHYCLILRNVIKGIWFESKIKKKTLIIERILIVTWNIVFDPVEFGDIVIIVLTVQLTVEPVLRGHLLNKEKVAF